MPRGVKTCSKCGNGCGPRCHECPSCGHSFTGIKAAPRPAKVSGDAGGFGPGRKQCKQCSKFVGVRTLKCECGYDFTAPKVAAVMEACEPDETGETVKHKRLNLPDGDYPRQQYTVYAPSGDPPYLPKENSEEAIASWGRDTIEWGRKQGKLYTEEALKYWLRKYKYDTNCLPISIFHESFGSY